MVEQRLEDEVDTRARLRRGAIFYTARMVISLGITALGIVILTRLVGPAAYGTYAAIVGLATFLQIAGRFGVDAYLTRRRPEEITAADEKAALSFLSLTAIIGGIAGCFTVWHLAPAAGIDVWPGFLMTAGAMFNVPAACAMARLERNLRFEGVATIELASQLLLYSVAVTLALKGFGLGALACGYTLQQVLLSMGLFYMASWRLLPSASWTHIRALLTYGGSYSASVLLWQTRQLALVAIITPLAGVAAAGQVALAVRLVEVASVFRTTAWRMAMPALARVRHALGRLSKAVDDGTFLSVLAVGVPCAVLCLVREPLILIAFGGAWSSAASLIPLLAIGSIANVLNYLTTSAMHALERNRPMILMNLIVVSLLGGLSVLLLPEVGLIAYGLAEVTATIGYMVLVPARRRSGLARLSAGTKITALALAAVCGLALVSTWLATSLLVAAIGNPYTFRRIKLALQGATSDDRGGHIPDA
jgi:PST family polysaccharide transporter